MVVNEENPMESTKIASKVIIELAWYDCWIQVKYIKSQLNFIILANN